jgi:hypothetical protein
MSHATSIRVLPASAIALLASGCIGGYALNIDSTPHYGVAAVAQPCPSCSLMNPQGTDSNGEWTYDPYSGEPSAAPQQGSETTHFLLCDIVTTYVCYDVYHRPQWTQYQSNPARTGSLAVTTYFPKDMSQTADSDGDKLPDIVETQVYLTDPHNKDTDGDGIGDGAEVLGYDWVDYPSYGANPRHKDVFVEVDYEEYTDSSGVLHSWKPSQAVLDKVAASYAALNISNPDGNTGITVHFLLDTVLGQDTQCNANWKATAPFNAKHQRGFHYVYFANGDWWGGKTDTPDPSTGTIYTKARSFVCGPEADTDTSNDQNEFAQWQFYAAFVHELGHSLGLGHGGGNLSSGNADTINCKPNYPSLMNYYYQFGLGSNDQTLAGTKVGFSSGALPSLVETALQERNSFPGIDPAKLTFLKYGDANFLTTVSNGNLWVDWNADGAYSSGTLAPTVIRRYPPCNPGATPISTPLLDRDDSGFIASVLHRTIDGAGN